MTILDLFILLIVAAVCGSIGMAISGYSRGGERGMSDRAIGIVSTLAALPGDENGSRSIPRIVQRPSACASIHE